MELSPLKCVPAERPAAETLFREHHRGCGDARGAHGASGLNYLSKGECKDGGDRIAKSI